MPHSKIPAAGDAPYRIKDLSEKTGVSREAIRFYINEGLLPPARKTAHNMGWYSDRHVELLGMIQKLQSERFLPLKAIKMLLRGGEQSLDFNDAQIKALDEMRRKIVHQDLKVSDDAAKLARDMGLSRWEQKELLELGIATSGAATISDIEITQQWIAIRDAGFSLERGFSPRDLMFMKDVVEIALRSELSIFSGRFVQLDETDAARVIDVVVPALSRLFGLLHERRVAEYVKEISVQRQVPAHTLVRQPAVRKAQLKVQGSAATLKRPKPRARADQRP